MSDETTLASGFSDRASVRRKVSATTRAPEGALVAFAPPKAATPQHAPAVADRDRAIAAVRELLFAVGADVDRPNLARTPSRVADLFIELFSGIGVDPASELGTPMEPDEAGEIGEVIALTSIAFRSVCEHHLLPFTGTVDVHYAPRAKVAGFGRIAAVVESAARRPQIQERLGADVARALMTALDPKGVIVRIEASHDCIAQVNASVSSARAVTVATLGTMPRPAMDFV